MLKKFLPRRWLVFYLICVAMTWLEAVINPSLVRLIVASFEEQRLDRLWQIVLLGMGGNLFLLLGLAGKRYGYARLAAGFRRGLTLELFTQFASGQGLPQDQALSAMENDVTILEQTYLEPLVIIYSSVGFTLVSIAYALMTNFWLGLLFTASYALPALLSGLGSRRLNQLAETKSAVQQGYLNGLTNLIAGGHLIRNYQAQAYFTQTYETELDKTVRQDLAYQDQRTKNALLVSGLESLSGMIPIVVGGWMTAQGQLSAARFVAIYLVSYNIGYQFQELAYFLNTLKSSRGLQDKYQSLFGKIAEQTQPLPQTVFPLSLQQVSFSHEGRQILSNLSCQIESGQKVALIGPSGSGKSTLLDLIYGDLQPDQGQILFAGQPLRPENRYHHLVYLKQDSHCFDGLTVEENICLGQPDPDQQLPALLEAVKLSHLSGRPLRSTSLSGGERQRLDLARSLFHRKSLILADEIKANLDKETATLMADLLLSRPETLIEVIHHYSNDDLSKYDQVISL